MASHPTRLILRYRDDDLFDLLDGTTPIAHDLTPADVADLRLATGRALGAAITHSTECWRWHPDCAVREVERVRAQLTDIRTLLGIDAEAAISDPDTLTVEAVRVLVEEDRAREGRLAEVESEREHLHAGIRRFYVTWAPHLPPSWREHFEELLGDDVPFLGARAALTPAPVADDSGETP